MFGLGGSELILIFVLALLLFGPRKLPEIGRMLGRTVMEFRRATHEFRTSLEREVELEKVKDAKDAFEDVARLARPRSSLIEAVRTAINEPGPRPDPTAPPPRQGAPAAAGPSTPDPSPDPEAEPARDGRSTPTP